MVKSSVMYISTCNFEHLIGVIVAQVTSWLMSCLILEIRDGTKYLQTNVKIKSMDPIAHERPVV